MDSTVRERLTRVTASLFFLVLLIATANSIVSVAVGPQNVLSVVSLFSKLCVALFYTMIVWFTLTRDHPLAQAAGWQPRVTALLGSFLFMVSLFWLKKPDLGIANHLTAAAFLATGSALMLVILAHLGKSFSIMAEARTLVVNGPYAIVRHPLYVAEVIATLGVLIEFFSWAAVTVVTIQFAFQFQRMRNEEAVLLRTFPIDYARYMARTKRLFPGIW
jgi:protein-S-isoprenylcysteine O-methyltransferase Ste14